ncbi:chorismate-binding protein, partial [Actinotignum timonense]|nr:chorismate-binding protein [Actinotignum timonense]
AGEGAVAGGGFFEGDDVAGNGEFGIALRGGHITGNLITLYAGGGIMPQSIPAAEFAETEAKMLPMLSAVAESR